MLARDPAALETDAFFARFVAGLERTLAPRDLALLLQLAPAPDPRAYARLAAAGRVDGFVLTDVARDDPRFAVIEAAGVPAVVAGHPGPECPFPWLETAHGEGMAAAARHLAARGHERIGFLGGAGRARLRPGAARALARGAGRRRAGARAGGVRRPARRLLAAASPPSPRRATCSPSRCSRRPAAAGRDLAVTGFDDSPLAVHNVPALTSVRVDYAEFGAAAAAALLRAIDGADPAPARLSPPVLVVRASS